MERREQRAGLHDKGAAGDLLDAARDAEAVQRAGGQRLQDEQVERALEKSRSRSRQWCSPIGIRYEFLSNVNRRAADRRIWFFEPLSLDLRNLRNLRLR
jgi:hypothetical protein